MSKTKPQAREPIRVVVSAHKATLPRRVSVEKPDGCRYTVAFPAGHPMLLIGEAECRAVDNDVATGVMLEVELPDRHVDDLLAALADKQALAKIAELQNAVRELGAELNNGTKPKFTIGRDGELEVNEFDDDLVEA